MIARIAWMPVVLLLLLAAIPAVSWAAEPLASATLAETKTTQLPAGSLVWRLESFPDRAAAEAAAGDLGLVAESGGQVWLATLGPAGGSSTGGTLVAEIGPISAPNASEYLLRAVELTGPAGSQAGVHMHPGSEVYYVAAGTLTVLSDSGEQSASAGQTMSGPSAGTAMQPKSTGAEGLRAIALFVVDAGQPFSSPAALATPGMPNTGAGGTSTTDDGLLRLIVSVGAMAALVAGGIVRRRASA